MSKLKRIIVVSSSDDEDEEIQQPRPKKKPPAGFPSRGEGSGFNHPSASEPGIRTDTGTHRDCIIISDDEEDIEFISGSSDERRPLCNIHDCFIEDITSPTSIFVTNFQETKHELVLILYELYNRTIFQNKLPDTMSIIWNKRLTITSAKCHFKKTDDGHHYCVINLSEKVCDSAERLRDSLVHEMCHAACWIINKRVDIEDQHGPLWRTYAEHVTNIHPELPKVMAYHNYDITYPYNYRCSWCHCSVGRFQKATGNVYCRRCRCRLGLMTTVSAIF